MKASCLSGWSWQQLWLSFCYCFAAAALELPLLGSANQQTSETALRTSQMTSSAASTRLLWLLLILIHLLHLTMTPRFRAATVKIQSEEVVCFLSLFERPGTGICHCVSLQLGFLQGHGQGLDLRKAPTYADDSSSTFLHSSASHSSHISIDTDLTVSSENTKGGGTTSQP